MVSKEDKLKLDFNEDQFSIQIQMNEHSKALLVFAHGAGAGMTHKFMQSIADGLEVLGVGTLRFNFLYMEQGKRRPDSPKKATATIAHVLDYAKEKFSSVPIFVGGKSFGGRMSSVLLAEKNDWKVQGIIFFGFPLHKAKEPSLDRAAHLKEIDIPSLFLQGTRDNLADLDLITKVTESLSTANLHVVEGADHSFAVLKRSGRTDSEVITELCKTASDWIAKTSN